MSSEEQEEVDTAKKPREMRALINGVDMGVVISYRWLLRTTRPEEGYMCREYAMMLANLAEYGWIELVLEEHDYKKCTRETFVYDGAFRVINEDPKVISEALDLLQYGYSTVLPADAQVTQTFARLVAEKKKIVSEAPALVPITVAIDRAHWDVRENSGSTPSRLLRHIQGHRLQCCLGFLGTACDVGDEMLNKCLPCEVTETSKWPAAIVSLTNGERARTKIADDLIYYNDAFFIDAETRERKITAAGREAGIHFEFTGEYLKEALAD